MNVFVEAGAFEEVDASTLVAAVERTVSMACATPGATGRAAAGVAPAEVSVTLLDDREITELNRAYLGHDRPTDVIAFALGAPPELVGDVYLGVEQARRQADDLGVPFAEELVRLVAHGTLHVLGYDHPEGEDRYESPMFALQERVVHALLGGGAE